MSPHVSRIRRNSSNISQEEDFPILVTTVLVLLKENGNNAFPWHGTKTWEARRHKQLEKGVSEMGLHTDDLYFPSMNLPLL